jgi:hypothetical protein
MTLSDDKTRYPLSINKKLKSDLETIASNDHRTLNNLIEMVLEGYRDKMKREGKLD